MVLIPLVLGGLQALFTLLILVRLPVLFIHSTNNTVHAIRTIHAIHTINTTISGNAP